MTLDDLVGDFARGLELADARRPVALNQRSKKPFRPGIGPHTEARTIDLVMAELASLHGDRYGSIQTGRLVSLAAAAEVRPVSWCGRQLDLGDRDQDAAVPRRQRPAERQHPHVGHRGDDLPVHGALGTCVSDHYWL